MGGPSNGCGITGLNKASKIWRYYHRVYGNCCIILPEFRNRTVVIVILLCILLFTLRVICSFF